MRAALAAFFFGALFTVAVLLVTRHLLFVSIQNEIGFHFDNCVFGTSTFPESDLDNGRLLRRALFSPLVTIRYFDRNFQEVTRATAPGRYGAVVKIDLGGELTTWRFITLYRTPARVPWDAVTFPVAMTLPAAQLGLDPVVDQEQQREIGWTTQRLLFHPAGRISSEEVAILLAGLSETKPGAASTALHDSARTRNGAWWYQLQTRLNLAPTYRYLIDLPQGYQDETAKRWPLILFLHHGDAGGSDLDQVRHCGLAAAIRKGRQLPAVVISPQCPDAQSWSTPVLNHLLDEMTAHYRIDPDRVYITGVSAGGDETWNFALIHPERLAAIAPMAGESDPSDAAQLKGLPIWAFQGARDPVVPPGQTVAMVDAVRQAGGHAHLTLYPDMEHNVWDRTYASNDFYTWLLAQRRGQPEVITPGTPSP